MMLKISVILFLFCTTIILAKGQQKPYTKFKDTIVVKDQVIFEAQMIGSESENFIFAVCEDTGHYFQFGPRHCNVTIQKEAQKRTCPVYIASNEPEKDYLSELIFYSLGDDKVIITWRNQIDYRLEPANQFKILEISTCQLIDVPLPADQVIYVATYANVADIGFWNKTYCASGNCKITINADGKQISGPTDILKNVNVAFNYPIGPINLNLPHQGFYMAVGLKSEYGHGEVIENIYRINGQGKSVRFMAVKRAKYARPSTSHDLFSLCHTVGQENTTIACVQYDKSLELKLNTTIQFEDGQLQRWLQPYNLKDGGLLLVTGRASDVEGKYYDTFSMIKIHPDGQRGETMEVNNLNFICPLIGSMYVKMLENESGEICAHFTCTYDENDERQKFDTLQLAIKCLSKA